MKIARFNVAGLTVFRSDQNTLALFYKHLLPRHVPIWPKKLLGSLTTNAAEPHSRFL
jgi:hypothetical protein